MSAVETDVFGRLRPRPLGLEKQLPDLFVRRAEESLQGPRTIRIKLPHVERPALAGENPVEQHHLNHISETGVLLHHIFYALLQHHHLIGRRPVQALFDP